MAVTAIWSGGQSGADQGGLEAGEALGLETGGWMPKGFLTEDGLRPDLAVRFGMQEHASASYRKRTLQNVLDCDGTVILGDASTGGTRLTLAYCREHGRPHLLLNPLERAEGSLDRDPAPAEIETVAAWLREREIGRLNVAGNRESGAPGLQRYARELIVRAVALANRTAGR